LRKWYESLYLLKFLLKIMKKLITSISKIAVILSLSAIVVSCNKEQGKNSGSASKPAGDAQEIVYVNSDSLLSNYDYYKDVRDKFQEKSKKAQADLTAKGTAFQREVAAYQQGAGGLNAEQRATTEERLARKQQELATYNQNAGNALANEEAAENDKLYNKVSDYLKVYAKSKGYKIVLTYSKSNPAVLYADESLDVTKAVVDGLNSEYKKEKK